MSNQVTEISVEDHTLKLQRQNFAKVMAQLAFLATIPEDKVAGDDISPLSKEAAIALQGFKENPSIVAVHKTAQFMGIFNEQDEFTSKGAAIAQTCLNARANERFKNEERAKFKVNYKEFVKAQGLGGLFALQKTLVDELKTRIEEFEQQDGFKAQGQTQELFEQTSDFYAELAGIEIIEE